MANITVSELANHIPTITVNAANQGLGYLAEYLNMGRTVRTDFGSDFARKGDVLNIPKRGTLSVNTKSANTSVTKQTPSDDVVAVTLNQHREVTFVIEDAARAESIEGITDGYAQDAGLVLAEDIEDKLAALYASAGTTLALSSYNDWTEALKAARRVLVNNKIPKTAPLFAQMDPYAWEAMLNVSNIEDASAYGDATPLKEGSVRRLAGINLFESQVVGINTSTSPDTYYDLVYAPEALALAVRPLPDDGNGLGVSQVTVTDPRIGLALRATASYDPDNLAVQMTMDVLYGVKVIRPEHFVAISHQPSVDN